MNAIAKPSEKHHLLHMEKLLHYTWRHLRLPLGTLRTTEGQTVEIVDPGLYNRTDSGPDFFNAKVKIDGVMWAGNVELHQKASDWYRHHHDSDPAYDNVVLHVVENADMDVENSAGQKLTTVEIPVPSELRENYETLLNNDRYPPCYSIIPELEHLKVHSWLSALQTERLEHKTLAIEKRVADLNGSWEDAYFSTLARNFGFSINGDAFEEWLRHMPMHAVAHHRDDLFQVEAMFLGQAGLLNRVDGKYAIEYRYLQTKFHLEPMDGTMWKYLRTRPQNFAHVRLMQLARMYHERRTGLSELLACEDVNAISQLYGIKGLKLDLLIINTAVPMLFAYGRNHSKEFLCDRAFALWESLRPEANRIIRMWSECGLEASNAGDSQALIQLKNEYCDRKECVRCRFGYEFLSGEHRQAFIHEPADG